MKKSRKIGLATKKKLFIFAALLLVIAVVLFALEKRDVINLYSSKDVAIIDEAKTTSTTKTAQEDFSEGNEREPGNSLNENEGTGGVRDVNGEFNQGIDTNNPIISESGEISLYTPGQNASVKPGALIAGASSLPKVSFRIIDNVTGVISTGELSVKDGKFAGYLDYTTPAKEGRLDIFGTKDDGSEFSSIEVMIRLN